MALPTSLLPGFGGRSTFDLDVLTNDEQIIDMSQCATAAVVLTTAGGGSVAVSQSFDGVNWTLVDTLTTAGDEVLFQHVLPIGQIKLELTDDNSSGLDASDSPSSSSDSVALESSDSVTDATARVTVVGFKLPVGS